MYIKWFLLGAVILSLIATTLEATSTSKDAINDAIQGIVEKGGSQAKDTFGTCDDQGHSVRKEMKLAAEQGNVSAQYKLAVFYANGLGGVEKDLTQALHWYRKAAEQGHADAQYHLALMYEYGEGVEKDFEQAVDWYRKAIDQGHEDAFRALEIHFTPE